MRSTTKWLLGILIVVIVLGGGFLGWQRLSQQKRSNMPNQQGSSVLVKPELSQNPIPASDYRITIKDNNDINKIDIYLKNLKTDTELFFATVDSTNKKIEANGASDAYRNGNVYIYAVINGQGEIWKYSRTNLIGTKLFTDKEGFGFYVSPDEKYIGVTPHVNNSDKTGKIVLLDGSGKELKTFTINVEGQILSVAGLDFDEWKKDSLWIDKVELSNITGLAKIDLNSLTLKEYNFSSPNRRISINSTGTFVIGSDFPRMFDVDSAKQFEIDKTKVNLYLYDLSTGKRKVIATAGGKDFEFGWVNDSNYTYTDPETGKVVTGKAK
ncbi:MAG: hypothetical protein WCP93_03190 [Candidatus Berkelbacteria bacterium]